jgi:hypothetical protein
MQMGHALAAVRPIVDDQTVAGFIQPQLRGHRSRFEKQMAQQFVVLRAGLGDAGISFLGMIKTWTGAWALMSRKASTRSSS